MRVDEKELALSEDYDVQRSWATEPEFYRAPHPDTDKSQPRPYQHAGVEYQMGREHGIIGDAPGVGKTAQAIMLSNAMGAKSVLVVPPASLVLNWEKEIWRWSTIENVYTCPVTKAKNGPDLTANYVMLSYDMLRNAALLRALMSRRWDHVILDEAHYLKDPRGNKRTKAVCGWMDHGKYVPGLIDVADRVTALTGTLTPNQPIECYNVVRLTNHAALDHMSENEFREHYYAEGGGFITKTVWEVKGGKRIPTTKKEWSNKVRNVPRNLDDLQYRLRKHVMVRRLKQQVLPQLPPTIWQPFPIALSAEIRGAMRHPGWNQVEHLFDMGEEKFDGEAFIDGEVSTARRLLGEAKAPAVAEYIEDMLSSGTQKIVVGAWHKTVLDFLRDRLFKYGLTYMDGGTSLKGKQEAVDRFQDEDDVQIILGQIQPLGLGWTLTRAQDVVFAEPDWVPGVNQQLLDRINRFGQMGDYTIGHVPVVPGTIDERILARVVRKDKSIYLALDHRQQ